MLRLGLAVIGGTTAATAIYALLRVLQKLVWGDADPALILYSEHAGYFWRSWTAAYAGVTIAFVVWVLTKRAPERVGRWLAIAVPGAAVAIVLQGVLVP